MVDLLALFIVAGAALTSLAGMAFESVRHHNEAKEQA
jgi:hypothetical protein